MEIIAMAFEVLVMVVFVGSLIGGGVWLLSFIINPMETVENTKWAIEDVIDNWKLFLRKDK